VLNGPEIEAILFDSDGVMFDSEQLHFQAHEQLFREHYTIQLTWEGYAQTYIGVPDKTFFPQLLKEHECQFSDAEIERFLKEKAGFYIQILNEAKGLPEVHSVENFVKWVVQKHKKIALVSGSSSKEVTRVLEKLCEGRLQRHFKAIVTSDNVKHQKPNPEGYLLAARQLGVEPSRNVVLEDFLPEV